MNKAQGALLSFAIAIGSGACYAQDAPAPVKQPELNLQLSAKLTPPFKELERSSFSSSSLYAEMGSSEPSAGAFVRLPPFAVPHRTLSAGYFLLNGLHAGMAVLDVEATHHCLVNHSCKEGNPLMPTSRAGQFSVDFAFVGYSSFVSYRLRKQHRTNLWWIAPSTGSAAHAVGAASSLAHW